ncbi:hypothetical protein, partial [Merismopedia glauca]
KAFDIYRSRFAEFLAISLKATTWLGIPFLVLLAGGVIIASMALAASQGSNPESVVFTIAGLGVLLVVIYFALLIFCGAKSFTNEALIARLSFGDLSLKPETVKTGWEQIRRRMWHIWLARFMVGVIIWAASVGISLVSGFLVGLLTLIWREPLLARLLGDILELLGYVIQLWLSARFLIPDLSVAMEQIPGDEAITRAWNLSQGKDFLIMAIVFVAGLMAFPAFIVSVLPFFIFLVTNPALWAIAPDTFSNPEVLSQNLPIWQNAIAPGLFWLTISLLLASCLTLLYIPFWQALRAVIYHDLTANRT